MWRLLSRWFAPLLVAGSLVLPAPAQEPPAGQDKTDKAGEKSSSPLPLTLVFVSLLLVLVVVCMPSRKR